MKADVQHQKYQSTGYRVGPAEGLGDWKRNSLTIPFEVETGVVGRSMPAILGLGCKASVRRFRNFRRHVIHLQNRLSTLGMVILNLRLLANW